MRISAISSNDNIIFNPAFRATFVENEFSKELKSVSSKEDIMAFEEACRSLQNARKDNSYYLLDGVTINNGFAGESEIGDKFIKLGCKLNKRSPFQSIWMWVLRSEDSISGGIEKKDVLKEITKYIDKFAKENVNREMILKKI